MKHFYKVASGVLVQPLAHAIARQPWLWDRNTFRTKFPNTPHSEVSDIWLRFSDSDKCDTTDRVIGDDHPIWHDAASSLPQAQSLVLDIMRAVGGYALDRLLITRLRPGGRINPHADKDGSYVDDLTRSRYHCVIQGLPGSVYKTGDEEVEMRTGEVWWFNPWEIHSVYNGSSDDRIHLLIDVRIWP